VSIDLFIDTARPIAVKPLLAPIGAVLAELLGVSAMPTLVLESLDNGDRLPVDLDQIASDARLFLVLSIGGDPETVGLLGRSGYATVTISGPRTALQFALGAAAAIVLARESEGGISDDRRFFGEEVHTTPQAMLERLRVVGSYNDYREAAEAIRWGPGAS
jgi:hypothetical protein